VLLIAAAIEVAGCSSAAVATVAEKAPPGEAWLTPRQVKDLDVKIETVTDQPVGGTIRAVARVTFDDLRVAHVFSPVTGRITKILTQPGQQVKKGQALCAIQSPDLGSAMSDLAKAEATLLQAEKDWQRQKELIEQQAASRRDYESAQAVYFNAKAEVTRAQRKAKLLRQGSLDTVTQEFTLQSPIDGEIIMRGANPGLEVQGQYTGGATVELFTIGKLDRVWVLADVFEMDLPRVKNGTPVSVSVIGYPGETFPGHVEWISGALDPTSRTAKVRCSIDNRALKLKPEMYGTALLTVDVDRKLAVKRSAVFTLGDQSVAFVQAGTTPDGQLRFARRIVAVEETEGGDLLPIKQGLQRNDRVVSSGGVIFLDML
jgi:cobalt-zinc-cadmium efflux system membrane fusion protein